jgi:hypothetical protein
MIEALLITQTVIYLLGIGGLAYWVRKWFRALEGALDAQRATIEAQKIFMESLSTFLNIADAPKMAERYEAFKKMVEHEKNLAFAEYERKLKEAEERALAQLRKYADIALRELQKEREDKMREMQMEVEELTVKARVSNPDARDFNMGIAVHSCSHLCECDGDEPKLSRAKCGYCHYIVEKGLPDIPPQVKRCVHCTERLEVDREARRILGHEHPAICRNP